MRYAFLLSLAACSGAADREATTTVPAPAGPRTVVFTGMCDASGAVARTAERLIVADDEDNVLRLYDPDRGGEPLAAVDISPALGLPLKGKKNPQHPETDLEAATRLGDRAYWVTSHGRNKKGKLKEERLLFFATTVTDDEVALVGRPYDALLDDLLADPRYAGFGLAEAAELAPKEPGGLNIEGLTATPDGRLLFGFRNPIPDGLALVIPLDNAAELVDRGASARFGDPIRLDLGGQGIRSLSWWHGRYLVIAGDIADGGPSHLYRWDGAGAPERVDVDLAAINPEGFFSPEERGEIMLLSDDGSVEIGGVACKELEDPAQRRFRGLWIRIE